MCPPAAFLEEASCSHRANAEDQVGGGGEASRIMEIDFPEDLNLSQSAPTYLLCSPGQVIKSLNSFLVCRMGKGGIMIVTAIS